MNVEAAILRNCQKGDRRAQNELFKQCYPVLMEVCTRYKNDNDEARAILNVGFLKILKNLDKYRPEVPFVAWVKRIMINTIIDEFRKNKKESQTELRDFTEQQYDIEIIDYNEADRQFDADRILEMIKLLPPMTQKVFNLYAIDGFNHVEIGKMLGMSDGTSKWHLSAARKKLQSMIAKQTENEYKKVK